MAGAAYSGLGNDTGTGGDEDGSSSSSCCSPHRVKRARFQSRPFQTTQQLAFSAAALEGVGVGLSVGHSVGPVAQEQLVFSAATLKADASTRTGTSKSARVRTAGEAAETESWGGGAAAALNAKFSVGF